MTDHPQGGPPSSPRARRAVADDPFWSVVRRRHPDVDVVLLPPEEPPVPTPPGTPTDDPEDVAAREDAAVRRAWARLVGDLGTVEASWQSAWTVGGASDRVRREATLSADGVDVGLARGRLSTAAEALRGDGWHVLVPPDGLPRVMAGRQGDLGRAELQLVLVPDVGRLVLRVRSADHAVGEAVAHELVVAS